MSSSLDLPRIRLGLYAFLGFFQFFLFIFCAARLGYTLNIPKGDSLNGGIDFYDPVVIDLLVNSLFGMAWSAYIFFVIFKRKENLPVKTFRDEIIGVGLLWFWLLVGAAVASTIWANINWCQAFSACRVLSALLAFAWLSWITLTIIFGCTFLFAYTGGAWNHALHGHWDPTSLPSPPTPGRAMSQV